MKRREFIALMGASVAWPFAALAQQAGRTYRLGCLWSVRAAMTPRYKAFFDELRRLGFIEGQNLGFGDLASLKAKISRSIIAHMGYTLI